MIKVEKIIMALVNIATPIYAHFGLTTIGLSIIASLDSGQVLFAFSWLVLKKQYGGIL